MQSLDPIYTWLDTTWFSHFLQASTYTFPIVEAIHLMGITIMLGAVVTVCLRLLGFGIRQEASGVYSGIKTWSWVGFWIVLITGVLMVIAEPIKLSRNSMFGYKLYFLAAGYLLHFFGYLMLVKPGRAEAQPMLAKVIAVLLLVCWIITGTGGRLIGFV
jgi:hypothetical protein